MKTIMGKRYLIGFSLIEVIIFIAILSIFFVTAMAVVTYSLQSMKSNENKIKATQYAEELMEWIRAQKEADWQSFTAYVGSNNNYCFNSAIIGWPAVGACSSDDFSLPTDYNSAIPVFRRSVSFLPYNNPVDKVDVNIVVQWKEPGGTKTIPLNSILTLWE